MYKLKVEPVVDVKLPGIISYTVTPETEQDKPDEQAARLAIRGANADIQQVLTRSRRRAYLRQQLDETESRQLMIEIGVRSQ